MPNSLSQIRLGVINPMPTFIDEQGRHWVNHSIGRLLEEFRRHLPETRICMPVVPNHIKSLNHVLDFPRSSVVALPPLGSVIHAQRYFFPTRRVLRKFAASSDALFMRLPFQLPSLLCRLGKPKLLHIAGNTRAVVAVSSDYRGPLKWAARGFAWFSEHQTKRMIREPNTRVASNGAEMWRQLGCRDGRVVVSSCLYRREMEPRASTKLNDPPRLLFVGYLRPEKGAHVLLDAFDELRRRRPMKLTLAGGMDRSSNAEEMIRQRIASSPFRDDITMTGMVDFGPELFSLYREHDVYVMPSFSEGTPRTLIEARGFGCPVIATRVGGIPESVTHERDGLLFESGNARELAHCIIRVLDDEPLRKTLMEEGFRSSERHSLENFGAELVSEIAALFGLPGPQGDVPNAASAACL